MKAAAADSVPLMYRIEGSEKFRRLLTTLHRVCLHLANARCWTLRGLL